MTHYGANDKNGKKHYEDETYKEKWDDEKYAWWRLETLTIKWNIARLNFLLFIFFCIFTFSHLVGSLVIRYSFTLFFIYQVSTLEFLQMSNWIWNLTGGTNDTWKWKMIVKLKHAFEESLGLENSVWWKLEILMKEWQLKRNITRLNYFSSVKYLEQTIMMVKISMDNETFGEKNLGRKNSVTTLETYKTIKNN